MPRPDNTRKGWRAGRCAATVALVSGMILGLNACSSTTPSSAPAGKASAGAYSSGPAVPKGAPQAIAHPGLTQGMALPLEAYMETYPEQAAIARAQVKLVATCMAKYGFNYAPPTPQAPLSNDDANLNRRYGISDPDEAAQYGYHLPGYATPQSSPTQVSDAEEAVMIGHSGDPMHPTPAPSTYNGVPVPQDGCIGSSTAKLGAKLNTALADKLDYSSLSKSQAEPVVQTALHAWSTCMKSKGYTVDTPFHASTLAASSNGPSPTSQEIAVAVADVACKQKTKLVSIWFAADSAVQRQQVEQNQLPLTQLRQQIDAAVKASAAVTG